MPRFFVGDQSRVTFRFESGTYATPTGANNWPGLITNHGITETQNVMPIRYAGTNSRLIQQFLDGAQEFAGTLSYYPQSFRMLKFVLGSAVDGGSPSPYTHTYSPNHNNASAIDVVNMPLPPFTIVDEKNAGVAGSNFIRTINGCVANSWTLSAAQGGPVSCDLTYVGQSLTYSSGAVTNISGTDVTRPYMWRDVRLRIPSGTAMNEATDVSLTITNNLAAPHYVDGNRTIGQPVPENLDVELRTTVNMTAETAKDFFDNYFMGGSTVNVILGLQQSVGSEEAIFTLSGCKLIDMNTPSTTGGVQTQTLVFSTGSLDVIEYDDVQYRNYWSGPGF